jgi:hypothetical protein
VLTTVPRPDSKTGTLNVVDLVFHDAESDFALIRAEPHVAHREHFAFPAPLTVGGR